MTQPLPPGQNPVDPRGAFSMPPSPGMPMPPAPPTAPVYPQFFSPPLPPPRPPRRRWVLITLLLIALIFSMLVNLMLLGAAVSSSSGQVKRTILSGEGLDKVAVIPITGLIDDNSDQALTTVLKDVAKDLAVKAVVVEIDTPGGSASASAEMHHRLEQYKAMQHVPLVIAMRGMATSGGYYIASAGDYIFAEPGCLTGNIGVLMPRFNVSQMINKWGIYETTLTATAPGVRSFKNAGSMFGPSDPQDEKYLQGLIDGTFAEFQKVVQTGRKGKIDLNKYQDIFSGKAFLASEALDRGLIDQIGFPDAAFDYAAQQAGLSRHLVVKYEPNQTLLQLLTAKSPIAPPEARGGAGTISAGGVSVDIRSALDLLSPRPMMLWRGN